jgi:hypothetical protein
MILALSCKLRLQRTDFPRYTLFDLFSWSIAELPFYDEQCIPAPANGQLSEFCLTHYLA